MKKVHTKSRKSRAPRPREPKLPRYAFKVTPEVSEVLDLPVAALGPLDNMADYNMRVHTAVMIVHDAAEAGRPAKDVLRERLLDPNLWGGTVPPGLIENMQATGLT